MSDVITKFKLETAQFDSKLKTAAKELSDIGKDAIQAGRDFEAFTSKSVESARALGNISTSAATTKGKVQELVGSFNEAAKAYNALSDQQKRSDWGKAMSDSLTKLSERIKEAKTEMQNMPNPAAAISGSSNGLGGIMNNALSVFGGNLLTKATMAAANFGREMVNCVQQGIEMARQGEGIRIAFERLGRGDILEKLRKETHGTVTDLELMKAAVKFNDFRLPLDQLGTMLAFAQQKAKDTGQSVDYMVESIVNGLGRKSKLILDNLGISAAELDKEMAKTGDMTEAVGNIIRRQMGEAGDYIETAADRATAADVRLKNSMEELGRTFQPLSDASSDLWTNIKTGCLDLLNSAVKPLINALTEAGRLRALNEKNSPKTNKMIDVLGSVKNPKNRQATYNKQVAILEKRIKEYEQAYEWGKKGKVYSPSEQNRNLDASEKYYKWAKTHGHDAFSLPELREQIMSFKQQLKDYKDRAKLLLPANTPKADTDGSLAALKKRLSGLEKELATAKKSGNLSKVKEINEKINSVKSDIKEYNPDAFKVHKPKKEKTDVYASDSIRAQQKLVDELTQKWMRCSAELREGYLDKLNKAKWKLDEMQGKGARIAPVVLPQGGVSDLAKVDLTGLDSVVKNKKINIDLPNNGVADAGKEAKDAWKEAASAISSAGGALQGIQEPGIKVAAIVGQAIANIALGFAAATSKDTKLGVWGWIAAVAGGLATMIGTIASIKSATAGSYERGGLIPGNSFSGDNLVANVNAGELILSRSQQRNVAAQLQGGGNPLSNLKLETAITDRQIVVMLRGYDNKFKKL